MAGPAGHYGGSPGADLAVWIIGIFAGLAYTIALLKDWFKNRKK